MSPNRASSDRKPVLNERRVTTEENVKKRNGKLTMGDTILYTGTGNNARAYADTEKENILFCVFACERVVTSPGNGLGWVPGWSHTR